jgi:hypothetical protein
MGGTTHPQNMWSVVRQEHLRHPVRFSNRIVIQEQDYVSRGRGYARVSRPGETDGARTRNYARPRHSNFCLVQQLIVVVNDYKQLTHWRGLVSNRFSGGN